MIERLVGTVEAVDEKTITVLTAGVGYAVCVADPLRFSLQQKVLVFIHAQWSQERGLVLYGFLDVASRALFNLLVACNKVGAANALALLRQLTVGQIVQAIMGQQDVVLSQCPGVGPKKAQQIVHELKDKVGALSALGHEALSTDDLVWQHAQDALISLNYSKQEASKAIAYVSGLPAYKENSKPELNLILRQALAFLSTTQ